MSINRRDYIIFGWKLPYDVQNDKGETIDLWDDKFLPMIEGHKGEEYIIIRDGMCGDYTVFGLEIANDSGNEEGWAFLNLSLLNTESEPMRRALNEKYEELFNHKPRVYPKLFIFSHFS